MVLSRSYRAMDSHVRGISSPYQTITLSGFSKNGASGGFLYRAMRGLCDIKKHGSDENSATQRVDNASESINTTSHEQEKSEGVHNAEGEENVMRPTSQDVDSGDMVRVDYDEYDDYDYGSQITQNRSFFFVHLY